MIDRPDIVFEQTHLTILVGEGEVYQGSFTLKNKKDGRIRGLVYPSSFRVRFQEQGFEGEQVVLNFTYDASGMHPGQVEKGRFTIVCNGGEYEIGFTAIVERPFLMTPYGKIQNLKDFKRLAMQDFTEAHRLFRSRDFYEILRYEDKRVLSLYDNMRKWSLGEQAVEEFLVGVKQKECIFYTFSTYEKKIENLKEERKESFTIWKNTWGFMPTTVRAECDFVQLIKNQFSTDDFIGNQLVFEYVVQPQKLHAGKNYGRIFFETPYETIIFELEVDQTGVHSEDRQMEQSLMTAQIFKEYLACIGGRDDLERWAKESIKRAEQIRMFSKDADAYQLLKAHIYLESGQEEEARWILDNYNYNRFDMSRHPEVSAYYLYLTAMLKKTGSHVNRVVEEINKSRMKYPQSWRMLCMIVDIDPEYKNLSRRLAVLEKQFFQGARQVMFYLQAFKCFREDPSSLKKLGVFEIQVLHFAAKYKLFTKELALYTANLASQQKRFDRHLYHVLEKTYAMYEDPMILTAICTLLIKGNQMHPACFRWYQKAVEEDLKIVQLYEYYMMTIDENKIKGPLPRSICLYFMHGNTLNYKKAALLYANIIQYQEESSDIYIHYRESIERFAWEQLDKRHVNESLRIIYKRFCTENEMTKDRILAMRDVCHAYEVRTKVPGMKDVIIIEKDGEIGQRVPCQDGRAQIFLYDKESRIIWESINGRHYADSIPYDTTRLFYELRFMDMCKNLIPETKKEDEDAKEAELTFGNIRLHGFGAFEEQDIFKLCSKKIREEGYEEDDFLLYLCFELFKRGQYDKTILTYLANYYCGATKDMKRIWHVAQDYEINTYKLAERIITQMVFSEDMFAEEEIFVNYYEGNVYFRLKQAYLAYVSREYVLRDRHVSISIFQIMAKEYQNGSHLPDICKIALLKYYSQRECELSQEAMLRKFLRQLCEKQIIFPFYLNFKESWLREVMLYDKTIIAYRAEEGSKVMLEYQIRKGDRERLDYQKEILVPVYENIYVKSFILYEEEGLRYFFRETKRDGSIHTTEKQYYRIEKEVSDYGEYGRLNDMTALTKEARNHAMKDFWIEKQLAEELFVSF